MHLNDLLPLPYTGEALRHLAARVGELQDFLGRQVLLENVSSYLTFTCSELSEPEFLTALVRESGCGLLLDINNVYVSARNHGFDARAFIAQLPGDAVQEIHLAGHSINRYEDREILIDTHSTHVCEDVWSLYDDTIERLGPTPTLIEWEPRSRRCTCSSPKRIARTSDGESNDGGSRVISLHDLQQAFASAVRFGDAAAIAHFVDANGIEPERRVRIYANNVRENFLRRWRPSTRCCCAWPATTGFARRERRT